MQVHNTVARHGQHAAHVAEMPLRGFDVLPLGKEDADAVQVFVLIADFCAVILHGLQQGFTACFGVVEHNQGAFGVLRCGALRRLQAAFGGRSNRRGALAGGQKDDGQEQGAEISFSSAYQGFIRVQAALVGWGRAACSTAAAVAHAGGNTVAALERVGHVGKVACAGILQAGLVGWRMVRAGSRAAAGGQNGAGQ